MRARELAGGQQRARHGFILQAVGPGGERRWWCERAVGHSDHPDATQTELLARVIAALDALPGQWKVETISAPSTIYRDLQGSRRTQAADRLRTAPQKRGAQELAYTRLELPEAKLLGQIGRLDMLARRDAGAA